MFKSSCTIPEVLAVGGGGTKGDVKGTVGELFKKISDWFKGTL
jgi:hypothetical protein